ncbi:MAG: DUF4375 domain-containing protein [Paracoccus sp. (in: a-proteobacteria)]|nr:DUF4375 domain-containing protein [Paracoccus sp. (in: a-proteobacteria)]
MNRFAAALWAFAALPLPALASDACAPGAVMEYPFDEAVADLGFSSMLLVGADFHLSADDFADSDANPDEIAAILANMAEERRDKDSRRRAFLAQTEQPRRDILLLTGLDRLFHGSRPLISTVTLTNAGFLDAYLDALDRQGLDEIAALIRQALTVFGPETDPARRYDLWVNAGGAINPVIDGQILALEARLAPLQPQVLSRAVALVRADPGMQAEIRDKHMQADALMRLVWAVDQVLGCAGNWYAEADAGTPPLAALPEPQRDLARLHLFMNEVMNGGVHQFFFNSSGALAPDIADILDTLSLPDHAGAIRQGIASFPAPYPRATEARRGIMDGFDEDSDAALDDLTYDIDDGEIYRAMIELAISSGFMPELADAPQ